MDLIVSNNLAPEVSRKVVELETTLKRLKEEEAELKEVLFKTMDENGIVKIENEDLCITWIAPTTRESLDTKLLRKELPDIYDEYVKFSRVKGSVRVKLK